MGLNLREIRQNTTAARKLMERARAEKFAVGAFNLDNQETLKAVARAAVAKKSPVLVAVSHSEAQSIGIENIRDMVDNYKKELGIEIYLCLDHSPSLQTSADGIENGFEFIHLDILQTDPGASVEDIIGKTRQITEYARLSGALVEGEPYYFMGKVKKPDYNEVKKTFSTPEGAKKFVSATGIDIFSASIGNLHDKYPLPKTLDLELLKNIRETVDCGISLHGGADIPAHYFEDAVKIGVSKVNVDYDLRLAFRDSLEKVLKEHPEETAVFKLMDDVISAVQSVVEAKIDMLGSAGKAS